MIYSRLHKFLQAENVLYDGQFGYRKFYSTSHALNYSIEEILEAIDNKLHVIGIFIDLSKAFDTIDHEKLLIKLENYGIRSTAHNLIKSYLSNRQQYTKFDNEKSDVLPVHYGVPQGSVLGPLLFLIYINDIIKSSTGGRFILYADDTNIFIAAKSISEVYQKSNAVLECISNYMHSNLLHINMTKCKYIYFKPHLTEYATAARVRKVTHNFTIQLNGKKIKRVSCIKFLGVIIDENLNWWAHREYLLKKLNQCIGAIKRIKSNIPKSQYANIYHSLFESHLSYGITVWGGVLPLDDFFTVQKRCIRMLFGSGYIPNHDEGEYELENTKPLFRSAQILTVHNLYNYHILLQTSKIIQFRQPYIMYSKFEFLKNIHKDNVLIPPLVRLDRRKQSFFFSAATKWNQIIKIIKVDVKTPLTAQNFKLKLKNTLQSIQQSGNEEHWDSRSYDISQHVGAAQFRYTPT